MGPDRSYRRPAGALPEEKVVSARSFRPWTPFC